MSPSGTYLKNRARLFMSLRASLHSCFFFFFFCADGQVGRHIAILFDSTLEDPSLLTIPQHLLANEAASCTFADVLLSFLVHQMDDLAGYEDRRGVATGPRRRRVWPPVLIFGSKCNVIRGGFR